MLEKAKESYVLVIMSILFGIGMSNHPFLDIIASLFIFLLFNVLLMLFMLIGIKNIDKEKTANVFSISREHVEGITLLYFLSSTTGYVLGNIIF